MEINELLSNPFALMLSPEDVFRALKQSEALNRLEFRICRPLDMGTCFQTPPGSTSANAARLSPRESFDVEGDADEEADGAEMELPSRFG